MPTYQYACTSCGERLEVVQKFSDEPLTTCPACQGALRKVFSAVGVVFKGSGFYKTDSRSSGKSAKPAADKSPSEATTSSPEGAKTGADAGSGNSDSATKTSPTKESAA